MAEAPQAPGLDFSDKVVVIVGGILAAMALSVLNPVLPSIDKALSHSPADSSLVRQLFGFTSLAMAVGAPLGAWCSRKFGMRRMLIVASLIYAIAGTAGLYLNALPLLLFSRLAVGACAAAIQVMSLTLINTKCVGNDRAKWMGIHVSVATLITLPISPLSGLLGQISWHLPFALYVVSLALFATLIVSPRDGEGAEARAEAAAPGVLKDSILSWFPWRYFPLSLLLGTMTFMPTAYGPFLLAEKAHRGPGGIGLVLMGGALMGAGLSSQYGRARRSLSAYQAFIFSFAMAGTGALTAALTSSVPLLIAGLLAHAIGISWFVPNIMTALGAKLTSARQARAAGLVKTAHFLSAPLCIYLKDSLLGDSGASTAMLTVGVIAFAMLALMLFRMVTAGKAEAAPVS
ncbi:MAG: MFS transporter [Novosphingobium sp.]